MSGERALIRRVIAPAVRSTSSTLASKGWKLLVGIGDDAAVLQPPAGSRPLVFASDMLVENVHFRRRRLTPERIGWKALARNLSDLAAMGAAPVAAVVSLGLPRATPDMFVRGLYRGLARCARKFDIALVGGDTTRASQVVVDVAVLGEVRKGRAISRRGVLAGDRLFVTGRLGNSYASGKHARFTPRLREAEKLRACADIRAMIDLSDGLAAGLWELAKQGRVRLHVRADAIPRSPGVRLLDQALNEGEDFELLFAVSAKDAAAVPRRIGACPVTAIGEAVQGRAAVVLVDPDGRRAPLTSRGFEHFSDR